MKMGRFGGGRLSFTHLLKHPIALIEVQSCAFFSLNYRTKLSVITWSRTGKPLVATGVSSSDLLVFAKARWHFTGSQGSDFLIKKLLWFFCSQRGTTIPPRRKHFLAYLSPKPRGKGGRPQQSSPNGAQPFVLTLCLQCSLLPRKGRSQSQIQIAIS